MYIAKMLIDSDRLGILIIWGQAISPKKRSKQRDSKSKYNSQECTDLLKNAHYKSYYIYHISSSMLHSDDSSCQTELLVQFLQRRLSSHLFCRNVCYIEIQSNRPYIFSLENCCLLHINCIYGQLIVLIFFSLKFSSWVLFVFLLYSLLFTCRVCGVCV
jgi:hypothetical protein